MNLKKGKIIYLDEVKDWEKYSNTIDDIYKQFNTLITKNLVRTVLIKNGIITRKKNLRDYSSIWEFIKSFFISNLGKKQSDAWMELIYDLDTCYLKISPALFEMVATESDLKGIEKDLKNTSNTIPINNLVLSNIIKLKNKHSELLEQIR